MRTLTFPEDRTSGAIFIAPDNDRGSWSPYDFERLSDARGEVVVPAGHVSCLLVAPGTVHDIAPLRGIPLDAVHVSFTEVDDKSIRLLRGIPALRAFYGRNTSLGDVALEELGRHEALQTVVLRKTRMSDEGLAALATLQQLDSLDVSRTRIRGAGAAALERLGVLRSFDASETRIRALGIEHLARFPALERLSLYRGSRVGDAEIARLGPSQSLRRLYIGETNVTNTSTRLLGQMPRLVELDLLDTRVDEHGLRDLGASKSIERLTLGREQITGEAFAALPPQLRCLSLFETRISVRSLMHLSKFSHLRELHIHNATIDDSAVDALAALAALTRLTVSETGMTHEGMKQLRARMPNCAIDDYASSACSEA